VDVRTLRTERVSEANLRTTSTVLEVDPRRGVVETGA
jgi:hypothetical protein